MNTVLGNVFAQTRVVNKLVFPVKRDILFIQKELPPSTRPDFEINAAGEPATDPLLSFNDLPLLNLSKPVSRYFSFFTELSFADVFESGINSFKPGIVTTYDDHITELFKDAPSLVKVKCIIPL